MEEFYFTRDKKAKSFSPAERQEASLKVRKDWEKGNFPKTTFIPEARLPKVSFHSLGTPKQEWRFCDTSSLPPSPKGCERGLTSDLRQRSAQAKRQRDVTLLLRCHSDKPALMALRFLASFRGLSPTRTNMFPDSSTGARASRHG